MAPVQSRRLLVWTLPPIALILGFLWYRRKRSGHKSDPGELKINPNNSGINTKSLKEELEEASNSKDKVEETPKKCNRSLSGIESEPIDIIIPQSLRASKTPPVVISDKDLDIEIEKIKSMKSPFAEPPSRKRVRSALSLELEKNKTPTKLSTPNTPETKITPKSVKTSSVKKTCGFNQSVKEEIFEKKQEDPVAMAQAVVEPVAASSIADKLASMNLDTNTNEPKSKALNTSSSDSDETTRQSSERDSANHSPADVMLASPSLSSISDNHSEGSSDSGKGCSDVATPAGDGSLSGDNPHQQPCVYEFVLPQQLVGRLIGRHGCFVHQIKAKTQANILIKRHPETQKLKVCAVEGTQAEIDNALKIIRQKFPEKRYPNVTLEQVSFLPVIPSCTLMPECIYLKLVEFINNDTIMSHVDSPIHLFLQQHTHPSYPNLSTLIGCMTAVYNQPESPPLPQPVQENAVCAAPLHDSWYRAIVLSTDLETDTSLIQYMDFGGYNTIENTFLRQIRADFMTLPFQSAECILANLRPKEGEEFPENGVQLVEELTRGYLLQTQVVSYTPERIPIVFIYVVMGPGNIIFLNREIAEQGIAEWIEQFCTVV